MKTLVNRAIMWLYGHVTLQFIFFVIQMLVCVGWAVCLILAMNASTPELAEHYQDAMWTHLMWNWVFCALVLISGATKFGRTLILPKFITYDAED